MDSVETDEKGFELYEQLSELWSKARMFARKWISNYVNVLQQLLEKNRAGTINLEAKILPQTKSFGVTRRSDTDMFTFSINKNIMPERMTKKLTESCCKLV